MTDEQFQLSMEALLHQTQLLDRLVHAVEARQPAPGYVRGLNEFRTFDWNQIDATVTRTDVDGVSVVTW